MAKRNRLILMAVVILVVIAVGAGVASAAAGPRGADPAEPVTESTLATESGPPDGAEAPTDTTASTDTTLVPDPEDGQDDPEDETASFGDIISSLREAGDHTPAAIIMGKDVPGWDPDKHPGSTTDITAYPPGQDKHHDGDDPTGGDSDDGDGDETGDDSGDDESGDDESGDGPAKDRTPAGQQGKTAPGRSK